MTDTEPSTRRPAAPDVTAPAFRAEVSSDTFWDTVRARRAARSTADKLRIDARYRHQRAQLAAAELRQ